MPLSSGDQLGPYEIVSAIGAGGMGEVYKARDTRLDRTVAVKVLPDHIAKRDDLLARFEREARAVASLNHPNICTLHDIGPGYMVMELIEGETLAARIEKGAIPLDQALKLATQIADALDRAHRAGVTHRDVKPQNIMLTRDGVKVLDFGLAKSQAKPGPTEATLTAVLTTEGTVMGTPQYMAPELFEGKEADTRSDIWAFGAVVYEMVTGQKAFQGKSYSSLVGAILSAEPPPMAVHPFTPAWLERLVRRCLEKDAEDRYQSMRDVVLELRKPPAAEDVPAPVLSSRWPWTITAVLAIAAAVLGILVWRGGAGADPKPLLRFAADLDPGALRGRHSTAIISPDGSRLVFTMRGPNGKPMLATRRLDETKATLLSDTEDGFEPFFSPDGQWIGFFTTNALKKISPQGGAAVTLCPLPFGQPRGGWWSDGGYIAANIDNQRILRVPEGGGRPEPLPGNMDGVLGRWPQVLPGSKSMILTRNRDRTGAVETYDSVGVSLHSLETGRSTKLTDGGYFGRYLPSGHFVYVRQGVLFAQPFDEKSGQLLGSPVPILEDVAGVPDRGAGQFDFSRNGTFVYLSGKAEARGWPLSWFDAAGKADLVVVNNSAAVQPAPSPDGALVAYSILGNNVVVYDPKRDTRTPITNDRKRNGRPVWLPDGKHLLYSQFAEGEGAIWWAMADGSGERRKLFEAKSDIQLRSVSKDGRHAAFAMSSPDSGMDLWTLPLDLSNPEQPKAAKPELFLKEPGDQAEPYFSPDDRWVAYQGAENDGSQIFVRPFPANPAAGKWRVSTAGGLQPVWSRDGKAIFFLAPSGDVMTASVSASGLTFESAKPRAWSSENMRLMSSSAWTYEVSIDGKRILASREESPVTEEQSAPPRVIVLLNFFDELRRRVPLTGR